MALDASIPLQLRPIQIENPMQQAGNVLALQGGMQRNALAGMQMQQLQRQTADDDAMREILRDPAIGGDATKAANALRARGLFRPAMEMEKSVLERRKTEAGINKDEVEVAIKHLGVLGGVLAPLASRQDLTPDDFVGALQAAAAAGVPMRTVQNILQAMPQNAMQLPTYVRNVAMGTEHGLKTIQAMLPQVEMTQTGGTVTPMNKNPLAGPIGPLAGSQPIEKTPTIPEGFTKGADGSLKIDPGFLAGKSQIAAAGRPQTNVTIKEGQRTFENENKLRDDYSANPIVKSAAEMQNAFRLIETANARPSPANDMAMATKYMKILDPNSVVRESELALALNATGVMDRVFNYAEQITKGMKLNPKQRQDFYDSAKAINDAMQAEKGKVDTQFTELATGYGLSPNNVVTSLRTKDAPKVGKPAEKTVTRRGTLNGKRVVEYSDGTVGYE